MQIFKEGYLLPNEPSLIQSGHSKKLTRQFITPALSQIEAFLLYLRADVDRQLQPLKPFKSEKPYPLGQCLEISLAMQDKFRQMHKLRLEGALAIGQKALVDFTRHGGAIRQIWGDLRGKYFQNAFQIGGYYVDVSNDTVVATKPKVEILPFDEAGISPIRDYEHFARIAGQYWNATAVPNHIWPELAPFAPMLLLRSDGNIYLKASSNYMLALVMREKFKISESVIDQEPLDKDLFLALTSKGPEDLGFQAASPTEGRRLGLQMCHDLREQMKGRSDKEIQTLMINVSNKIAKVNKYLSQLNLSQAQINASGNELNLYRSDNQMNAVNNLERESMKKVQIDQNQYNLEQFSSEAKSQLNLLVESEHKIAQLRKELSMMQAARNSFFSALKPLLPPPLD